MSRKLTTTLGLLFALLLVFLTLTGVKIYLDRLPERISQHETLVYGENRMHPGSQTALRVLVRDSKDSAPLPGAEIRVALAPAGGGAGRTVFEGRTDELGTANVSFRVPLDAEPNSILRIETNSELGRDEVERPVSIQRDYRVLLTSDKPIYQPGQTIHLRALALSAFDMLPAANAGLELTIADGKGNKVFRETVQTDAYGVAAADFRLADQVNTGSYKINAALIPEGGQAVESEKTVTVERYALPKFKIQLSTEKPYYRPGERVSGSVQVDYFFGKPVAGGQVALEGFTFDVERADVFALQGVIGDTGRFDFDFDLPAYLAGSSLENGLARFYLQASVTDLADSTENSRLSLPVSNSGLVIDAIPEGGQFRPGVENILYILVSTPDGAPAEAGLVVQRYDTGENLSARTGPYGVAEVRFVPNDAYSGLSITATDDFGNQAVQEFYFQGEYMPEGVLLRPERPVYKVGETMNLTVLTGQQQGTVYLDIVRNGQMVSTRAEKIEAGRADIAIDLTPDLFGTLEVHAYKVLPAGEIVRDTRLVVVDAANDLQIAMTPQYGEGRDAYRPGDNARLDIQVSGQDGSGVQSALGLAVVDEAVFALAESDPGFAKLYFMLEQEILQPRYDLHGFSVPDLMSVAPVEDPEMYGAVEDTASASLAAAIPLSRSFSLTANSHQDAIQAVYDLQRERFGQMATVLLAGMVLVPLAALIVTGITLRRERRLWLSLAVVTGVISFIGMLILLWPLGEDSAWVSTPLERLEYIFSQVIFQGTATLLVLPVAGLILFGLLAAAAWRSSDPALGLNLVLLVLYFVLLGFVIPAVSGSSSSTLEGLAIAGLVAFLGLALAFLLRAAGFALAGRPLAAAGSFLFGLVLPLSVFAAVGLIAGGFYAPALRAAVPTPVVWQGEVMLRDGMVGVPAVEVLEEPAMEMEAPAGAESADGSKSAGAAEPPRLRQYFPETMLWLPDAATNADGSMQLEFPVADSITTWRVTALASSQDGRLGSATAGLRVFQDFFVDLNLPQALTVGDEISVPVGVFNYLKEPQTVRLELAPSERFELLDEPVKKIEIAPEDITVVYFRIRASRFGPAPFQVDAYGSRLSDAIVKEMRIFPNGKPISQTSAGKLPVEEGPLVSPVIIPQEAIPGTQHLTVKVYPGVFSQVVEGLDAILQMPYGCFEQTSSTTYPNVLALAYLNATGQAAPEVQLKAEEYINLGYQRLTTFEVGSSGGFSLFGDPPADRMLTAYGLQEFSDMAEVHPVDAALIQRAAEWMLSQQQGDGTWQNDQGLVHESSFSSLGDERLPVTAYVTWSLIEAGFESEPRTQKGIEYVREFAGQAEDPYVLALVANALVAADRETGSGMSPATTAVLNRLAEAAQVDGDQAFWSSGVETFMGSQGRTGSIETTALAVLALQRAGEYSELVNGALGYLIAAKDPNGTWYTTQATVLSLKALLENVKSGSENVDATVTVTLNGSQTRTLEVSPENFDVVQMISFDDLNPGVENRLEISVEGTGQLMYQAVTDYYLPWESLPRYPDLTGGEELVSIDLRYDRAELSVNDTLQVDVTVTLNQPGARAESALIDLGVPPGFQIQTEDLASLIAYYDDVPEDYAFPTIERYELTGRQILVYVQNLSAGEPLQFSYRLLAQYPLSAQTPASSAYDYYNPDVSGSAGPQKVTVTGG